MDCTYQGPTPTPKQRELIDQHRRRVSAMAAKAVPQKPPCTEKARGITGYEAERLRKEAELEREAAKHYDHKPDPVAQGKVTVESIQFVVARQYNVSRADLLSDRRTTDVVLPRQVAMYLVKLLTNWSFGRIGQRFGGRDHTTVLSSVRKIEGLVKLDTALGDKIENLRKQLQK